MPTPITRAILHTSDIGDTLDLKRSSEVSTHDRFFMAASVGTLTSGTVYAAYATARTPGDYTQIRFATGTTAPSGTYTDCRLGVWDSTATTKLAETANAVATVTAASTVYTIALGSTVTLTTNQVVFLGFGFIASTMPTVRGIAALVGAASLTPQLAWSKSGWLTGASLPSNISTSATGVIPWIELVP